MEFKYLHSKWRSKLFIPLTIGDLKPIINHNSEQWTTRPPHQEKKNLMYSLKLWLYTHESNVVDIRGCPLKNKGTVFKCSSVWDKNSSVCFWWSCHQQWKRLGSSKWINEITRPNTCFILSLISRYILSYQASCLAHIMFGNSQWLDQNAVQ